MKYSTAFSGKNCLNSEYSWAAKILFGESTRVGFWIWAMTLATVNVLPLPVTPRRTWCGDPARNPLINSRMACGWSPEGWNVDWSRKSGTLDYTPGGSWVRQSMGYWERNCVTSEFKFSKSKGFLTWATREAPTICG